jgi:hypothetical protein
MSVSLLRTETIFSLEFAPEDKADVWAAIQELFGQPKIAPEVVSATIFFGGESFTYQDEWDAPCLISSSARGKEFLERLAGRLAEEREARLRALRDTLNASLEKGAAHGQDDVNAFLAAEAGKLADEGY